MEGGVVETRLVFGRDVVASFRGLSGLGEGAKAARDGLLAACYRAEGYGGGRGAA
jgi:hypothetical protein